MRQKWIASDVHRKNWPLIENTLSDKGYLIYPGKLTVADSFRVGCIGRLGEAEMRGALQAIEAVLEDMGVHDRAPAAAV